MSNESFPSGDQTGAVLPEEQTGVDYAKIFSKIAADQSRNEGEAMTVEQQTEYNSILEKSRTEATLTVAGSLSELSGKAVYKGTISLQKRIENGEINEGILARATDIYSECFVEVGVDEPMRCGDGRSDAETTELSMFELAVRKLGPQAMGASQTYATAYRVTVLPDPKATFAGDLKTVRAAIKETGSEVGMHTDNHTENHQPGKTGCGAYNNHESGVEMYWTEDDKGATVLAGNIIGSEYDVTAHETQKEQAKELPVGYIGDGVAVLDELRDEIGPKASQIYVDEHGEVFAGVNMVKGTTFNRELFNRRCKEELGLEIQAFSIDAWKFQEVAEKLFPGDTSMQQAYVTACADWQARPAIFLTDGSERVIVRSPNLAIAA